MSLLLLILVFGDSIVALLCAASGSLVQFSRDKDISIAISDLYLHLVQSCQERIIINYKKVTDSHFSLNSVT